MLFDMATPANITTPMSDITFSVVSVSRSVKSTCGAAWRLRERLQHMDSSHRGRLVQTVIRPQPAVIKGEGFIP
jgi:hypothetical protein